MPSPIRTRQDLIAVLAGMIGLLAIAGFQMHEMKRELRERPPLLPGDPVAEMIAIHHSAATGERTLIEPEKAANALLDAGIMHTRTAPRLEPDARLVGVAVIGSRTRPLTLGHFELADGTRFSLFVFHDGEDVLPPDAQTLERDYLPIFHLIRDGQRVASWLNWVASGVRGAQPTRWRTLAIGGPAADDPFWDQVREAQAR